ncbi:MAG: hypothetical protein AAGI68_09920 [Planctomycetota bacterium]
MKRLALLCTSGVAITGATGLSHTDPVTFQYVGEVTDVSNAPAPFSNAQVGDAFSFIYTFDSDVPNTSLPDSPEVLRGGFIDPVQAARLTVGGTSFDLDVRESEVATVFFPLGGNDFYQVLVETPNDTFFILELERGPGLSSEDQPVTPPQVGDFGPTSGAIFEQLDGSFNSLGSIEFSLQDQNLLDPNFLIGGTPDPDPDPDPILPDPPVDPPADNTGGGGDPTPPDSPTAPGVPTTVIPTPATAVLGIPVLLGLAMRRRHRGSID